jgi:hypothetical protein
MAVADRSNAAQGIDGIPWRRAQTFTLNGALQALSIPGHHALARRGFVERKSNQQGKPDKVNYVHPTACASVNIFRG